MRKDDLTNEELAEKIKENGNAAEYMELLWLKNQNFVRMLSKKYCSLVAEEELLQEGFIGLIDAARHYDQNSGNVFLTYAGYWVKRRMLQCVSNSSLIHIPAPKYAVVREYQKIKDEIALNTGRNVTEREIGEISGVNKEFIAKIRKNEAMGQISSLNVPLDGMDNETNLVDTVADNTDIEFDVCKKLDTAKMCQELWKAVDELPEEQAAVIRSRYIKGKSFRETGEELGIGESVAVRMQNVAFRKLRSSKYKKIRAYYEAYICPSSVQHVGVSTFHTTWTSSVEKQAIGHLEGWGDDAPTGGAVELHTVTAQISREEE